MIDFQQLSEDIFYSGNEDELFGTILRYLAEYGYENVVISTYDPIDGPKIIQGVAADGWAETYYEQKFFDVDPAYKIQSEKWEPHTWRSIQPVEVGKPVREFQGISHECGMRHGLTACTSLLGRKMNFAISSRQDQPVGMDERMLAPAYILCAAYAAKMTNFHCDTSEFKVSHRERQAIQWMTVGLTNQEIADKMNVSVKTIEEMIRRVSLKNNVSGKVQIVVAAILNGAVNL